MRQPVWFGHRLRRLDDGVLCDQRPRSEDGELFRLGRVEHLWQRELWHWERQAEQRHGPHNVKIFQCSLVERPLLHLQVRIRDRDVQAVQSRQVCFSALHLFAC